MQPFWFEKVMELLNILVVSASIKKADFITLATEVLIPLGSPSKNPAKTVVKFSLTNLSFAFPNLTALISKLISLNPEFF